MSDTNRVGLRFFRSSQRTAPIPGGPFNLNQLRFTGTPNLAFTPNTIVSNEIRPDRQISDLILVGAEAGGDTGYELSYQAFDDLITGALFNVYTETVRKVGTGEITAFGAGTITVDAGTDFQVGQIVRLTDLATGAIGAGVYEITGIATNVLTVAPLTADTNAIAGTETADADTALEVSGFKAQANGDITLTVTGSDAVFQFPAGALDDAYGPGAPLTAGAWIKFAGFATAENNVWVRAREVDLAADTVTADTQTGMATDAAATEQVEAFYGSRVENGAQAISAHQFAVERRFEDHNPVTRELFLGMALNNLSIQLQPQAIAVGSVTWFGFNANVSDNFAGAYPELYANLPIDIPAPQFDVYNTSNDIGRLGRGVDPVDAAGVNFVLESTIELNNNLRRQPAVGVFGAAGIGAGELSVTGTLNTYFDNKEILEVILNNEETTLDVITQGGDGRTMVFDLPRIKFSAGAPDVPGKNQDVTIPGTYQALLSSFYGYTISVQRVSFAR